MASSSALNSKESTKYQNCSKNSIMSVSLEALAMAGTDCFSTDIDLEEWERRNLEFYRSKLMQWQAWITRSPGIDLEELEYGACEQPPLYLLAEQTLGFGVQIQNNTDGKADTTMADKEEEMKEMMRAWAKAVASMNEILCLSRNCSSTNVFR